MLIPLRGVVCFFALDVGMAMGFDILIYILYPYYLYGFFKKANQKHLYSFMKKDI